MSIFPILKHFLNRKSTSFKFVAMETKLKTIYKHQFCSARRCIFFTYWFIICIAKLRENLQFKYSVPRNYDIFIAQPSITWLWNIYSIYFLFLQALIAIHTKSSKIVEIKFNDSQSHTEQRKLLFLAIYVMWQSKFWRICKKQLHLSKYVL